MGFANAKSTPASAPAAQGKEVCEAAREMRKAFQGYLALMELKSRMQLDQSRLFVCHSANERTELTLSIIIIPKHLQPLSHEKHLQVLGSVLQSALLCLLLPRDEKKNCPKCPKAEAVYINLLTG